MTKVKGKILFPPLKHWGNCQKAATLGGWGEMEGYWLVNRDIFLTFSREKHLCWEYSRPLMFLLYYPGITATWLQSYRNKLLVERDGFCLALCLLFAAAKSIWGTWTNCFFPYTGTQSFLSLHSFKHVVKLRFS